MIKGHLSPHGCVLSELDTSHGSALRVTAAVMLGAVVDMEVTSYGDCLSPTMCDSKESAHKKKRIIQSFFLERR